MKQKRTFGSGSFRQTDSGRYQLRPQGKSKRIEATNDKAADRAPQAFVKEIE